MDKIVSEAGLYGEFKRICTNQLFWEELKSVSLTPIAKYGLGKATYSFDFIAPCFEKAEKGFINQHDFQGMSFYGQAKYDYL